MDQGSHNLLTAVGVWGVLLSPCYRTAVMAYIWHTILSRNIVTALYYEAREREARTFCSWFQGRKTDVQSESQGAVSTGADWSLSTLAPAPTATSQKKYKQAENSARMHFIESNDHINHIIW